MNNINAIVVDKTRELVIVQLKSLLNRLRLVYRQKVCGEASKQRTQIGKGQRQAIEIAQGA